MNFPYKLPLKLEQNEIARIRADLNMLSKASQYGWGHTIDFGPFTFEGILGGVYLEIAEEINRKGWWPESFEGMTVADIGCFSGGLTLMMADRSPQKLYAVDEINSHLDQAHYLSQLFDVPNIEFVNDSIFRLDQHIVPQSLDLVLMSGVLYHLSDMLVGLHAMRSLLKPGGALLIETNAVHDLEQSYANFGRFAAGMWWQPSGLCVLDMCRFMGFEKEELYFYKNNRCIVRAFRSTALSIPFKRGLNRMFDDIIDESPRVVSLESMAPVKYK